MQVAVSESMIEISQMIDSVTRYRTVRIYFNNIFLQFRIQTAVPGLILQLMVLQYFQDLDL